MVLDAPSTHSAGMLYGRQEVVANTPYQKSNEDRRPYYRFDGGFYNSSHAHVSNPLEERQIQEAIRRIQGILDKFNTAVNQLRQLNKAWENLKLIFPSLNLFLKVILGLPFTQVVMEVTPEASLLVKVKLHSQTVYIDLSFDTELEEGNEVMWNVYKTGVANPIESISGPIEFVVSKLVQQGTLK